MHVYDRRVPWPLWTRRVLCVVPCDEGFIVWVPFQVDWRSRRRTRRPCLSHWRRSQKGVSHNTHRSPFLSQFVFSHKASEQEKKKLKTFTTVYSLLAQHGRRRLQVCSGALRRRDARAPEVGPPVHQRKLPAARHHVCRKTVKALLFQRGVCRFTREASTVQAHTHLWTSDARAFGQKEPVFTIKSNSFTPLG